ncbi:MAG: FHA domain-containing protein [Anaerolinea sp.]|nr:FHA domain-containing protein [Anaerolinea sp.]
MCATTKNDTPVLIGQAGPLNGQRWMLERTLILGREPGCDVLIADRQVSRWHARLTPSPEGTLLEDLGSKNGTFLNGAAVTEPVYVQDGDVIQIALVQHLVYLSSDATLPLDAPLPIISVSQPTPSRHLTLDQRSRRVWIGSVEVVPPLSLAQFRLLDLLYQRPGQVISRQEVIEAVWREDASEGVSEQAFDALVRRLRERLAQIAPEHTYLVTIRGHGLRLDNPAE